MLDWEVGVFLTWIFGNEIKNSLLPGTTVFSLWEVFNYIEVSQIPQQHPFERTDLAVSRISYPSNS